MFFKNVKFDKNKLNEKMYILSFDHVSFTCNHKLFFKKKDVLGKYVISHKAI